jgi:hypothetical protein
MQVTQPLGTEGVERVANELQVEGMVDRLFKELTKSPKPTKTGTVIRSNLPCYSFLKIISESTHSPFSWHHLRTFCSQNGHNFRDTSESVCEDP